MVANTVGIQMPADFPLAVYNDSVAHVGPLQPRFPMHTVTTQALGMLSRFASDRVQKPTMHFNRA